MGKRQLSAGWRFRLGAPALMLATALAANAGIAINIGSGLDGNLTVDTNQTLIWSDVPQAVATRLAMPVSSPAKQIAVGSTAGIKVGDELLLYAYRANDSTGAAGQYESFHIASVDAEHFLTLDHAPASAFDTSQAVVVAQRVPNFMNVTVNGVLKAAPWNGSSGGLIFFRAKDTLDIAGSISAFGLGFPGGPASSAGPGTSWSLDGLGSGGAANGGGATLGADTSFQHLFLGSGGGGGNGSSFGPGGTGGPGGGLVYAAANIIKMTGSIDVSGGDAAGGVFGSTGGGGGSAGEVWLQCWDGLGMLSTDIFRRPGRSNMPDHGIPRIDGGPGLCRLDFHFGWIPYAGADLTATVDSATAFVSPTGPPNASIVSMGFSPALSISGTPGYSYPIQRTTKIDDPNSWATITSLFLTQPTQVWVDSSIDATAPANPEYFYRVVIPNP